MWMFKVYRIGLTELWVVPVLWCWGANRCWGGTLSPAARFRAGGWGRCTLQHILTEETGGQDVVMLEVFVNRWRCVLANVSSPPPPKKKTGRGKRAKWKALNIQWYEGHQDRKTKDFILFFEMVNLVRKTSAGGVFLPAFGVHRVKPQTGCPSGGFPLLQANPYVFPYRPHLHLCLYVCFSRKVMRLQLASIWQRFFFFLSPALESYIHRSNQFKR